MRSFPAILVGAVALASLVLTEGVRRKAISHRLIDVPNTRSSHSVATPRGGGVAIVLATLITLVVLGSITLLPWKTIWSLCGGGVLVAAVGFADDRGHVAPLWRLVGHFTAALCTLVVLGDLPRVSVGGLFVGSGWLMSLGSIFYIVWMINLTNFMDGIDGLASIETITVCVAGAVLGGIVAPGKSLWIAPVVLASATMGFLVWNWPPARIFMGDVGSGFLGISLAVLSLQAGLVANQLLWVWVIMLGVFIVDATVTLCRRMVERQRIYEAHRNHAYQHAVILVGGHRPVTMAVGIINLVWLFPIALMVALGWLDGVVGMAIAYAPIVTGALRLKAGCSIVR